jgi:CubicO group peptidase (beta-lactamase class C family)
LAATALACLATAAFGPEPNVPAIKASLASTRQQLNVPGIELAVWQNGRVLVDLADGVRDSNSKEPVRPEDSFHIGSITKSLTSALAGKLVDQRKLRWDSTIGEIFGKSLPGMRPEYAAVTLEDLLSHQGGIVARLDPGQLPAIAAASGPIAEHEAAAAAALSRPPAAPPQTMMIYSNPGYLVAAAMMEQATGKSWEELLTEEIFKPLQLTSAGFGPPMAVRGHMVTSDGRLQPLDPAAKQSDNPPFLDPAGRVHMNMADLARFAGDQLDGLGGKRGLLQTATYRRIHTEHLRHMELGWGGGPDGGFDNSGSNGRWLAYVRAIPARHMVVAVAVNAVPHPDSDEDKLAALVDQVAAQFAD